MLSKFKRKIGSILMRLIFPRSEISMEKRFIKEAYHFYLLLSKPKIRKQSQWQSQLQ